MTPAVLFVLVFLAGVVVGMLLQLVDQSNKSELETLFFKELE